MSYVVDDEDVQLVAEALKEAGWQRVSSGKAGFGSKMLKLEADDKKLKTILRALIEAKVTELPKVPAPAKPPLTQQEAMELLHMAIQENALQFKVSAKVEHHTKDVYSMEHGHGKLVIAPSNVSVTLEDLDQYDILQIVQYLRDH